MRSTLVGTLVSLVLVVPGAAAPDPKKPGPVDDSARIAEKLLERMDIEKRIDKMPLREVLEFLQQKTDLTILLDLKALLNAGHFDSPVTVEDFAITVPAMKRVRVETVLRQVVDQFHADFYIAPDHVRITTTQVKHLLTGQPGPLPHLYPEQGTTDVLQVDLGEIVRATPFVTATFRETPVGEALRDAASRAGRNVVISAPALELAQSPVTLSLSNVAFETAAASLAEAAGLRAFRTGNVVVIVTPERAKQVEGDPGLRVGLGGLGGLGGGGILSLAELETIARLFGKPTDADSRIKQLEEQLRKVTEELNKKK
jgi:hypothetical protein